MIDKFYHYLLFLRILRKVILKLIPKDQLLFDPKFGNLSQREIKEREKNLSFVYVSDVTNLLQYK
jgi:hypothetical protein